MNLIKRWKQPTPKKYKKWGKMTKNISYALGLGMASAAAFTMPPLLITIAGTITFITGSISAYCYAQIEEEQVNNKTV